MVWFGLVSRIHGFHEFWKDNSVLVSNCTEKKKKSDIKKDSKAFKAYN